MVPPTCPSKKFQVDSERKYQEKSTIFSKNIIFKPCSLKPQVPKTLKPKNHPLGLTLSTPSLVKLIFLKSFLEKHFSNEFLAGARLKLSR